MGDFWEIIVSVTNGNGVTYKKVRAELSIYENGTEKFLEKFDAFTENFKDGKTVTFIFKMKRWAKKDTWDKAGYHPHFRMYDVK